jgi:hypothetical protein
MAGDTFAVPFPYPAMPEAIPYKLTFESREDTAALYWREIAGRCRELEYDRVLFDRHIPAVLPPGGLYFKVKRFGAVMEGIKVAVVNPYAELDEKMRLAMLMAENIGTQFILQPDIEAAENWLRIKTDNDDDNGDDDDD